MSGKVKMRCARCGKPFKSSNAKQTLCSECEAKERAARAAVKSAPKPAAVAAPAIAPKIVGPGAAILDPRLAVAAATAPAPAQAPAGAGARTQQPPRVSGERHGEAKAAGRPPASGTPVSGAPVGRPQEKRPPREPKKRAPKPATQPFALTDELRARVEARYLELAQPVEYDGIRSKIATELSVPKAAVKKAVLELRQRMQMPSWWELQAYTGSTDDLERIRTVYLPYLPVPPVGIHKHIAADLGLDASVVYQGIRRLRAELRLPQYNPPDLHEAPEAPAAATLAQPGGEAGAQA